METLEPVPLEQAVRELAPGGSRWLADVGGTGLPPIPGAEEPLAGAVGPAGGFSGQEKTLLHDAGFAAVRLAGVRLRTETAGIALAAWWASVAGRPPEPSRPGERAPDRLGP
jgi:16S rRNA U1498 N3-methylase RsmE